MKKIIKQYKTWFLLFGIIILISPLLIRLLNKNFTVPTTIPYYFLLFYNIGPVLFMILPAILSLISIYLFYRTALNLGFRKKTTELAVLFYLLSVPTMYITSFLNHHIILFFIILLGFFLFTLKNKRFNILFKTLAVVVFLSTSIFGLYSLMLAAFLLAFHYSRRSNKLQKIVCKMLISLLLIINFIFYFILKSSYSYIASSPAFNVTQPVFQALISDFGSVIGIGITIWLLAAIGFIISWKYKFKFVLLYAIMFALIYLSTRYLFFIAYLNIIIVFLAAHSFQKIMDRKWDLNFIKNLTIIILICSFLFSAVSFANRMAGAPPDHSILRSLNELGTYEEGIVLSYPEKTWWIRYYSKQPVFGNFLNNTEASVAMEILHSKNIEATIDLIEQHNIRYIWIDPEMKEGQVWTSRDQGLLWLLPNKEKFKNRYNIDHVEIWEYID
ncbi:hypothetical protein GF371_02690 [Candidatus Woesearchaeota archaeon]|nr:hypothetical protein [Candidatus Woesearchaeota archaeon]